MTLAALAAKLEGMNTWEWRDIVDSLMYVRVDMIDPNPRNPRKNFDPESMAELVTSVRQVGILQPVVLVRDEDKNKSFRLVAGERRWRAAQEAGLESIPALVKELTPEQELEVMIVENLQRRDIDPIEEARGMKALLDEGGYIQEALAEKLGCSQGHIANRLRLLELPDSVQENISRGIISASHGKVLAGFKKLPEVVLEKTAEFIAENNTPVARTEELVTRVIVQEGRPLYQNYRYPVQFNTKGCKKCEHRIVIKESEYHDKVPYCLNNPCWEENQAEAKENKRREEAEKAEAEARAAKEREREEAAKKRAENETAKGKIQEQIQKTAEMVRSIAATATNAQDPAIARLISEARDVWEVEAKKRAYGYANDPDMVTMDRESIITLEGLLEYWRTKNEICKEATSMPVQFGDSTIIIQEQGIRFRGSEPYVYIDNGNRDKDASGALKNDNGMLKIENTNGQVLDQLPKLPIYYRISSYQYAGTKIVKQLVGIKTPTRTIMVFGNDSATMRKEIFALWIQLVSQLPPLYHEIPGEGVA